MNAPDENNQQINTNADETNISQAFSVLDSRTASEPRRRAAEALGNASGLTAEKRREITDRLIQLVVADSDDEVRAEAINSLYFQGNEYIQQLVTEIANDAGGDSVEDVFSAWLTSSYSEFRMVGATAMASFGEAISSELKTALSDDDPRVQARAVRAYGAMGAEAVEPIRPLLETYNSHVRHAAVSALTTIGTRDALGMLASLTQSSDTELRRIAVKHLYKLDTRQSAHVLSASLRDRSAAVRQAAMVSLIRLSSEGKSIAPRQVRAHLITKQSFDHELLAEDLHAIVSGEFDGHDTTETRRYAIWLLGELTDCIDHQLAVPWLINALENTDSLVADTAAAYIPELEATTVEKELQMLISDADTAPAVTDRAERILDRLRQTTAEAVASRSIEYTYVRVPSDYTEKYTS